MKYALIENNAFVRFVALAKEFPHTSFPSVITPDCLPENIVMVQELPAPSCGPLEAVEQNTAAVNQDGIWVVGYSVRPLDEQERAQKTLMEAARQRQMRNNLLDQSDWTQLADAPVDAQVWATYRQALRDVTQQAGFPFDIAWPSPPQP